jgi:hypothetical protein
MMDRSSLRQFLDREQIDPRSYGLDGVSGLPIEDREERYFLEEGPSGWSVCYWERGLRSGGQSFGTENEACDHLLELLRGDRTTCMR